MENIVIRIVLEAQYCDISIYCYTPSFKPPVKPQQPLVKPRQPYVTVKPSVKFQQPLVKPPKSSVRAEMKRPAPVAKRNIPPLKPNAGFQKKKGKPDETENQQAEQGNMVEQAENENTSQMDGKRKRLSIPGAEKRKRKTNDDMLSSLDKALQDDRDEMRSFQENFWKMQEKQQKMDEVHMQQKLQSEKQFTTMMSQMVTMMGGQGPQQGFQHITTPQPGQSTYQQPGQSMYQQPGQSTYQQQGQAMSQQPGQSMYQQPGQSMYQQPGQSTYQQPGQSTYQQQGQKSQSFPSQSNQSSTYMQLYSTSEDDDYEDNQQPV